MQCLNWSWLFSLFHHRKPLDLVKSSKYFLHSFRFRPNKCGHTSRTATPWKERFGERFIHISIRFFLGWFHPNQEGPKDVSDKWDDSTPKLGPKVDAALAEKESVYFFKVQVLKRLKDINNVLKQFNMFQIISKIQGVKEFFKWRSDPPPRLSNLVSIP